MRRICGESAAQARGCPGWSLLLAGLGFLLACRGDPSDKPPVHLVHNMDQQQRYDAQEPNPLFSDGRAMRPPVPGTVAVGQLREDDHLYRGRGPSGALADALPAAVVLDRTLLERGWERFGIYCSPCHDHAGTGKGKAVERGMMMPPSFHTDVLRSKPLGYFFEVITHGVRNMSSYAAQIPVRDRWAIAAYIRALQLSHNAGIEQVPSAVLASKGWSKR
jgi:mono/diheme cytochrome c family protein